VSTSSAVLPAAATLDVPQVIEIIVRLANVICSVRLSLAHCETVSCRKARDGGSELSKQETAFVAGAGGFIGGRLARRLVEQGARVRGVDRNPVHEWYQTPARVDASQLDLSKLDACREAVRGVDTVYMLAADMGGMGFIEAHKADCMLSVLTSTHMLLAARDANVAATFTPARRACTPCTNKSTPT
jgi:hypothetical protein